MLVLNLLNKIFGKSEDLSREEIDNYIKKRKELNKTERKSNADSFNAEALEGFSQHNLDTKSMKSLDKKMHAKFNNKINYSVLYVAASVFIILGVLSYIQFFQSTNSKYEIASSQLQKNEIEKNEIADKILEKEAVNEQNESEIKKDQFSDNEVIAPSEKKTLAESVEDSKSSDDALRFGLEDVDREQSSRDIVSENEPALNLAPICKEDVVSTKTKHSSLKFKEAKEVYYHELKLVDYRHYREAKNEEKEQLSGTPAMFESELETETIMDDFDENSVSYADFIEETMRYISIGKFAIAYTRCKQILSTYPDDVNANFYAGLSSFELKNYNAALGYFQNSYNVNFGNFRQEARFLMAKSHLALKNQAEAKKILTSIVAEDGFYKEQAKKLLE